MVKLSYYRNNQESHTEQQLPYPLSFAVWYFHILENKLIITSIIYFETEMNIYKRNTKCRLHSTEEDNCKTRSRDINILEFTGTFLCVLRTTNLTPLFDAFMTKLWRDNTVVNKLTFKWIVGK